MRIHIFEQWKVNELAENVPGAGEVLSDNQISRSDLTFGNAASMASASTDEMLAVMEYRLRYAAAHQHDEAPSQEELESAGLNY